MTVNNVAPTIVSVTANPSELPFDGGSSSISVSATDPAGDRDPLLYSFDCDNNGAFEIASQGGSSATCTFTEDDEGANTVNVSVDDQDGGVTAGSTTVTVVAGPVNVAPTADAGDDDEADEGSTVRFDATGSNDPDGNIVTFTWNFGDGATAQGVTQTPHL